MHVNNDIVQYFNVIKYKMFQKFSICGKALKEDFTIFFSYVETLDHAAGKSPVKMTSCGLKKIIKMNLKVLGCLQPTV